MAAIENAAEVVEEIRKVRQARLFEPRPVPDEVLDQLLEVARWTGSGRNTQPWHFILIKDKDTLKKISEVRPSINWVADAPVAIAIVVDGPDSAILSFDEGRLSERLFIAAKLLGLGGGTAWYGDADQQAQGRAILGIPDDKIARSVVVLGYPTTTKDHRPNANIGGRRPISEILSQESYGNH